jgi:oligopeptide transport system permease protein
MTDPTTASTELDSAPVGGGGFQNVVVPGGAPAAKPRSLTSDAWRDLRRNPLFLISLALITVLVVMSLFPQLFTSTDPTSADLDKSLDPPSADAWFGRDVQGYDIYARTIYGTRISIIVGLLATFGSTLIGGIVGILTGYYGGWLDSIVSRVGDVFLGIPFILGALVLLSTFAGPDKNPGKIMIIGLVVGALVLFGWPPFARIMRSSVIAAKQADYVVAARALGAGSGRIILRHLLPNCLAPTIVFATISLGAYIGAEATLSFLGIGLRNPVVSWGVMISDSRDVMQPAPHALFFPALFLSITVLSFVMLGDAVREALDPKLR